MNEKTRKILEILTEIDPMGLIAGGAPDDEYTSEAEHLAEKEEVSADVVMAEFSHMFWENCIEQYDAVIISEAIRSIV